MLDLPYAGMLRLSCVITQRSRCKVNIGLTELIGVDQRTTSFTFAGYFRWWWKDPRLKWNTTLSSTERIQLWGPPPFPGASKRPWLPPLEAKEIQRYVQRGGARWHALVCSSAHQRALALAR